MTSYTRYTITLYLINYFILGSKVWQRKVGKYCSENCKFLGGLFKWMDSIHQRETQTIHSPQLLYNWPACYSAERIGKIGITRRNVMSCLPAVVSCEVKLLSRFERICSVYKIIQSLYFCFVNIAKRIKLIWKTLILNWKKFIEVWKLKAIVFYVLIVRLSMDLVETCHERPR